eukprot:m.68216 g.68216  ORF g.68216 m.68216 type:complete len:211 (+) comp23931_c1_seq2:181-813(+)
MWRTRLRIGTSCWNAISPQRHGKLHVRQRAHSQAQTYLPWRQSVHTPPTTNFHHACGLDWNPGFSTSLSLSLGQRQLSTSSANYTTLECGAEQSRGEVAVAMSGGVDSTVAAAKLQAQGYDVVGVFMRNWDEVEESGECTSVAEYRQVQQICDQLGIRCTMVDFVKEYWHDVFRFRDRHNRHRPLCTHAPVWCPPTQHRLQPQHEHQLQP